MSEWWLCAGQISELKSYYRESMYALLVALSVRLIVSAIREKIHRESAMTVPQPPPKPDRRRLTCTCPKSDSGEWIRDADGYYVTDERCPIHKGVWKDQEWIIKERNKYVGT